MTQVHKKDAAAKIIKDEGGKKGHSIKKHLMQSPATGGKGISQQQLEKRTNNRMTPTVTAFNKPAGLTKAVKTAMKSPDYKPGQAQEITVPLTPHKSTGKLPSVMVASKNKQTGAVTTEKKAAASATVKFNDKGEVFRVTVPKTGMQAQTARTTPKPANKAAAPSLQQIANKGNAPAPAPKATAPVPTAKAPAPTARSAPAPKPTGGNKPAPTAKPAPAPKPTATAKPAAPTTGGKSWAAVASKPGTGPRK
jgi:hypothetical protein